MSVLDVVAVACDGRDPAEPVLFLPGAVRTRGEVLDAVRARAEALRSEGVTSGALVPLVLESDEPGVVTLLAAWHLGAVPAPLHPRLTELERARARDELREAPPGTQAVLWTSGTAGRPRGVALGTSGLAAHVRAVADRLRLDGTEAWLGSLSVAHVGGLALVARAFLTGARLVLGGRVDTDALVALLLEGSEAGVGRPPARVTHLSLVPTQLERLLRDWGDAPPPSDLRCILVGGAHAREELVRAALDGGWPIALTYGMTEMWSQVATATPETTRMRPGSVGPTLPGVELRIGSEGEILVRGPTRALCYLDGGTRALADDEGWYHTGDLGSVGADGMVVVTGRSGDRIITGGVNVDPSEVEDVLRAHPDVLDAAVVGVPDPAWGEVVGALIVPSSHGCDADALEAFVRTRLSGPKRPRRWLTAPALPLNANGKVDRAVARSLFSAA
jgi:O-succinylbenzoic acid--CoA ligase